MTMETTDETTDNTTKKDKETTTTEKEDVPRPPTTTEAESKEEEAAPKMLTKRLVLLESGKDVESCKIEIEEVPIPEPGAGEVLVKMVAAPINPVDYSIWTNKIKLDDNNESNDNNKEKCPMPLGKEGCGIIEKVGTGWGLPKVGTKVGLIGLPSSQGTYSEYVVAKSPSQAFPLPDDLTQVEDGAGFFINPYTAYGILDQVRRHHSKSGGKALIHTAAASTLGQMMVKLAKEQGDMTIINLVRRQEQADLLKGLGAEHVIVTTTGEDDDDDWKNQLKTKVKELNCTVAFDAVAGEMTGHLIECLPKGGTCYVYGALAGPASGIRPFDLFSGKKTIKGFDVSGWIQDDGMLSMILKMGGASKMVNAGLSNKGWSHTTFQDTTMETAQNDLVKTLASTSGTTNQKLRICFDIL